MTDFMVKLPGNFKYVYQFEQGKSQFRCVESCLSMAGEFAYPTRYANPAQLMSQIYTQYVGPDVAGDRAGTTKSQAIEWLTSQNIGFIDMQHFLDSGDIAGLHDEIMAQNKQNVPQLLSIGDESFLKYAKTGQSLHNWADALNHGSHTMLRVGFSDSEGFAYYMEPAAAPNFVEPVPITWQDFLDGHIVGCIAIMPPGVKAPPADFRYTTGQWPEPKPVLHITETLSALASAQLALDAAKGAIANAENDLAALKGEV